jgi:carboxylate-amine ligase
MDVVAQLVDHVRDALAANGDLAIVEHQLAELARRGTGAAEQVSWRKDGADDAAVVRHAVQRTLGQPA